MPDRSRAPGRLHEENRIVDILIPVTGFNIDAGVADGAGAGSDPPYNQQGTATTSFAVSLLDATDEAYFLYYFPAEFQALISAFLVVIPDATENLDFDVLTQFGPAGGQGDAKGVASSTFTTSVTLGNITEIDMSAKLVGVTALDYFCMEITNDQANLEIIGLRLRYRVR